jgi:hypothetical protein
MTFVVSSNNVRLMSKMQLGTVAVVHTFNHPKVSTGHSYSSLNPSPRANPQAISSRMLSSLSGFDVSRGVRGQYYEGHSRHNGGSRLNISLRTWISGSKE